MRSRAETLEALRFVLIEKIYPTKPILMRNDTEAASIVVQYVAAIWSEHYNSRGLNQDRTRFQNEARTAYFIIYPLIQLAQDTIRKYITELWRTGAFLDHLQFGKVKE